MHAAARLRCSPSSNACFSLCLIRPALVRNGGDPVNDPYASPMAVSDSVLASFPPMYAHVGSVDPLVDDVLLFARRMAAATSKGDVQVCVFKGVSHAYMHVTKFLPEAALAVDVSVDWMRAILDLPRDETMRQEVQAKMAEMGAKVIDMREEEQQKREKAAYTDAHAHIASSSAQSRKSVAAKL
jgi:hypothetical protein